MLTQEQAQKVAQQSKADKRYATADDEAIVNGIIAYYIACEIQCDYYIYINSDDVESDLETVKTLL